MPSCNPSPGSGGAMCSSSDSNSLAGRCGATLCALDTLPPRPLSFCLLVESLPGTKACFGVPSAGGFLAEFCVELLFLRSPRTFRGVFCGSGAPTCLPGFSAEGRRVTAENHHSTLPVSTGPVQWAGKEGPWSSASAAHPEAGLDRLLSSFNVVL